MRLPLDPATFDHGLVLALLIALPLVLVVAVEGLRRLFVRISTLPALALMPLVSRRLAPWVTARGLSSDEFFRADVAPDAVVARRREGLDRLERTLAARDAHSAEFGRALRESFSDLRFTDASRVPFPFLPEMRRRFSLYSVVTASAGPRLTHLDGHSTLDVSGSYGLNVAGFDRYKDWMVRAVERAKDLGPVLGPLHPVVGDNVRRLKAISRLDEVSFHMSGTEAVMAAARLVRFNTGRRLIVCFSGAYHGWWDGVQPGLGSERRLDDCLVLKDLHPASLKAIARRAREIAAVFVNPVQSFHLNAPPPNDAVLVTSGARHAEDASASYGGWLRQLREVCTAHGIPLVFDEVYTGFRLAPGGAQQHFGIAADMVVYGKTVAGGMPIGVVCGRTRLMRRVDPEHPMRMAYIVGTFSAHPLVMTAMNEFLAWVMEPESPARYLELNERCAEWAGRTNARLASERLPLRVVRFGTIWTVLFTETGRYNWLLQYYLRASGLTLSWVGTGRCLISMDFCDADFRTLEDAILDAARAMQRDGWWLTVDECPEKDALMKRRLIGDVFASLVPKPIQGFYRHVMQRKHDDHHASHNDPANQYLHLISSSVFIYCYAIIAFDLTTAMFLGLGSLFVRQFGHAVLEPACHDEEATLLGYNTPNKTLILLTYLAIPIVLVVSARAWSLQGFLGLADRIALLWFQWTLVVVFGRVAFLTWKHDFSTAMVWFVKLATDPFTDVIAYFPRRTQRA